METKSVCALFILLTVKDTFGVNHEVRSARVRRIVGGNPADAPPEDDPVIYVRFSGHSAKVTGVRDFPHYVFRGIRYAEAPVGRNRFQVSWRNVETSLFSLGLFYKVVPQLHRERLTLQGSNQRMFLSYSP